MGQPVYEVVGYGVPDEGRVLCVQHARKEFGKNFDDVLDPIFAGDEWDFAPSCDKCGVELDVCVLEMEDDTDEYDDEEADSEGDDD